MPDEDVLSALHVALSLPLSRCISMVSILWMNFYSLIADRLFIFLSRSFLHQFGSVSYISETVERENRKEKKLNECFRCVYSLWGISNRKRQYTIHLVGCLFVWTTILDSSYFCSKVLNSKKKQKRTELKCLDRGWRRKNIKCIFISTAITIIILTYFHHS